MVADIKRITVDRIESCFMAGLKTRISGVWNTVALDVGANIGWITVLLARRFEHVIAYEPSPVNVRLLRETLAANEIRNVVVEPKAVSARPDTLRFYEADFGAGSHVVSQEHLAATRFPLIEVPAVNLDSQNLPPIDFMKIDAEGHEPAMLAGARGIIAACHPLMYMEINVWCLCAFAGHSQEHLSRRCGSGSK